MKNKFLSRKFLMCLGTVLTGIGTSIAGISFDNEYIVLLGIICTSVGAGIYTFCEAMVDREAVKK